MLLSPSTLALLGLFGLGVLNVHALQLAGEGGRNVPIAVDQEPRHRIAFADDSLRVLEVRIPAHDTTLDHRHEHDLVTVNIENGPTRTWSNADGWSGVRARDVGGVNVTEYTGKAAAHIVQNVGEYAYRLTGVENRRTSGWTTYPPIDSPGGRVVADTRSFRAYDLHLTAGATVTHTHQVPVVVTLVAGAVTVRPGRTTLESAGAWTVLAAGVAHQLTVTAPTTMVEVEVR